MPKKEKLPPGWLKQESKSHPGKFYYFHKATRRTTWLLPTDEEPFQIRKSNEKESKCTDADTSKPEKPSRKSLSVKEKQESMVPRAVRQACAQSSSVSRPKKILNVSVLNRNNCSLVADYSSCSDGEEEVSKTKKKKEKDENENKIKKTDIILPDITERNKVQMKWKPIGPKILQPSLKLEPKEEQKPNVKDKDSLKKPKTRKKKSKTKKSHEQTSKITSSKSSKNLTPENSCLKVPENKKADSKVSTNDKPVKDVDKDLKKKTVTKEKSVGSKLSPKKRVIKQAKRRNKVAQNSSNLSNDFDPNEQNDCYPNVPFVPTEPFLPLPPVRSEIQNSSLVPSFGENDTSFNPQNISTSNSFHISDNYLLDLEDASQPMEVDIYPDSDMVDDIVKLRKDMSSERFNTVTGDLTKNFEMDTSNSIGLTTQPQVAYVVLDTNTLVNSGDLAVIKNICDGKYTAVGHLPYIIIPWVVMQELDVLKSRTKQKPGTAERAQRAIVFLSSYFTKKHPRVIGQTLKEAMQQNEYLIAENNDDKILQCCMQLESKYPHCKVVLYSNDVNLCNKTLINGIAAFNKTSICSGLSNLSGITTDDCSQNRSYTEESVKDEPYSEVANECHKSRSTKVAPKLTLHLCKDFSNVLARMVNIGKLKLYRKGPPIRANQVYNKLKDILKRVLGLVLETEMKAAFNEVWLKIIKVQPPWELCDILYCFVEHWYAVFGQIYSNRKLMETKYKTLLDYFSSNKDFAGNSESVSSKLTESSFILEPLLTKNPVYKEEVKCNLESIEILQQTCTAITAGEVDVNSDLEQLLQQQTAAKEELPSKNCLGSCVVPESSFSTEFAMNIALTKFQKVWEIFNSYCQEVEHTLQRGATPETCQQVLVTLQTSIPMMEITYNQFSSCLGFSATDILKEINMFTVLAEQLNAILPHLGCQDNDPLVNCVHLQTLFSNPEKREMLTNGLNQLEIMIRGLHTYQGHLVGT